MDMGWYWKCWKKWACGVPLFGLRLFFTRSIH